MLPAGPASNWYENYLFTLADDRLTRYEPESANERLGMDIAGDAFRAGLKSVKITDLTVRPLANGIRREVLAAGLEPEALFYGMKTASWLEGLAWGCWDGLARWVIGGFTPLDNGRESVDLTREFCRERVRARDPPVEIALNVYRQMARLLPPTADVADMSGIRGRLLEATRPRLRGPPDLIAYDDADQHVGGYHEGAWMTMGVLTEHPPEWK